MKEYSFGALFGTYKNITKMNINYKSL